MAWPASVTTALVYTRVSEEDQAREGVSLPAQLSECRRYAARSGWVLGAEYQDVMRGTRDDRPGYQGLLADVRAARATGAAVVVVVAALDRFGRRLLERVRCREELKALGVPVYSVREGGEVSDLVANVLGAVAEEEVRRLGERVRAANRHIVASGWTLVGGRPPWGYRWLDATAEDRSRGAPKSVLEPDPVTGPYAREAFERAAAGATVRSVMRWMHELPAWARGGRAFNFRAVHLMLGSPVYAGCTLPREGLPSVPGNWPALVDRATWEAVQHRIAGHAKMPRQASGRYLLTGLLRCPRCGCRMSGRGSDPRRPYYHCGGAIDGGARVADRSCLFSAGMRAVDAAVLSEAQLALSALGYDPAMAVRVERAWDALRRAEGRDADAGRVARLERERDRGRQRLTDAALKLVDGDIDKPTYELLRARVQADLDGAEAELARLAEAERTPGLPPLGAVLAKAGGWAAVLRGFDVLAQRDVLGELVRRVVPVRVARGTFAPVIAWTPLGAALRALAGPECLPVDAPGVRHYQSTGS